jgi:HSP20 family protein
MSNTMTAKRPPEAKPTPAPPKRDPLWSISPFGLAFGRLLDDFWTRSWPEGEGSLITPPLDVTDDDKEFVVTAELPGMPKDAIDIKYEDGVLTISGEKSSESEEQKANSYRMERRYGSFCRSLTLPSSIDPDRIAAKLENGVLRIQLPKSKEAKAKAVKIK